MTRWRNKRDEAPVRLKSELIQDPETYDPSEQDNAPLRDDFRILTQWIAQINDPNIDFTTTTKKNIFDMAEDIVKEIIKRKKVGDINFTASPEGKSDAYQELWEELVDRLSNEEIDMLLLGRDANIAIPVEADRETETDIFSDAPYFMIGGNIVDNPHVHDENGLIEWLIDQHIDVVVSTNISNNGKDKLRNEDIKVISSFPVSGGTRENQVITTDDLPDVVETMPQTVAIALEEDKETIFDGLRAPIFAIVIEGEITSYWDNQYSDSQSQVAWDVIKSLAKKDIDVIISGEFGGNAQRASSEVDIDLVKISGNIDDIIEKELQNKPMLEDMEIRDLNDKELVNYYETLHKMFENNEEELNPLARNHALVIDEMRRRDVEKFSKYINSKKDRLNIHSKIFESEYPKPWKENSIHLSEMVDNSPSYFTIDEEPPEIYLVGSIVNKGYSEDGHDIDIVVKQDERDERITRAIKNEFPDDISNKIQVTFDSDGPYLGYYIPLFRRAYTTEINVELEEEVEWGELYSLMKPKKASEFVHRFSSIWDDWAEERIGEPGIIVQPKFDGVHSQIQRNEDDILILTEQELERSDNLPNFSEEIEEVLPDEFIGEAEIVNYETKSREEALPRREFMNLFTSEGKQDDSKLVAHVWDVVYINGEWIDDKPYTERLDILNESIDETDTEFIDVVKSDRTTNKEELAKLLFQYGNLSDSEGAILKTADHKYKLTEDKVSRTDEMAKFKVSKELDLLVLDKNEVIREGEHTGTYNYSVYFKVTDEEAKNILPKEVKEYEGNKYAHIGTTYNFGKNVPIGGVITVAPTLVKKEMKEINGEEKESWSFQFPSVIGERPGKDPEDVDDYDFINKMYEIGNNPPFDTWEDFMDYKSENDELEKVARREPCPYQEDKRRCLLSKKFAFKMGDGSAELESIDAEKYEALLFPIRCKYASKYKCPYVKEYYYQLVDRKELEESDTNEIDQIEYEVREE